MGTGTGVAKGKARDATVERRWRRVVVAQGRSGLSVREFCRQSQLTETAFYHWRRELRRRQEERQASQGQERPQRRRSAKPAFVAVRVAGPGGDVVGANGDRHTGGRIEIVLSGGRRICVTGVVDRVALAEVVAVLEGLPVSALAGREVSSC